MAILQPSSNSSIIYEYRIRTIYDNFTPEIPLEEYFNQMSKTGWNLVSVHVLKHDVILVIHRRPLSDVK